MAVYEYKDTSLSVEEREYLLKHPLCKKLTSGVDAEALWSTTYGSRTISDAMHVDELYHAAEPKRVKAENKELSWSPELEIRNERCIDKYGCSSILW